MISEQKIILSLLYQYEADFPLWVPYEAKGDFRTSADPVEQMEGPAGYVWTRTIRGKSFVTLTPNGEQYCLKNGSELTGLMVHRGYSPRDYKMDYDEDEWGNLMWIEVWE